MLQALALLAGTAAAATPKPLNLLLLVADDLSSSQPSSLHTDDRQGRREEPGEGGQRGRTGRVELPLQAWLQVQLDRSSVAAGANPDGNTTCSMVEGALISNLSGNNLRGGKGTASDAGDCCARCRGFAAGKCRSWTFHANGGVCYLHGSVGTLKAEAGAVSGLAYGPAPPGPPAVLGCSTVPGVLGFGSNLRDGTANSTGDCCDQCRGLPKCASWTYHASGSTCYLHGTVGTAKPVPGAVSGTPHGHAPPPPPPALRCVGAYLGCFKDFVPAPGVPPVRALSHLAAGPAANMTVAACASDCATLGYPLAGISVGKMASDAAAGGLYSCYCGCAFNDAAPALLNSTCAAPCGDAPPGDGPCGAPGAMATFRAECVPMPPPSKTCGGNGSHPLPPGPACSQAASKEWKFCDHTLPLDERVNDLVGHITLQEAGALLTARESPAIPRLGVPAFYWGTNAIHGVQSGNATSFPQALNMGCTWNRTAMRGVGRTIGREMRALFNVGSNGVGLTSWSPTINLIR